MSDNQKLSPQRLRELFSLWLIPAFLLICFSAPLHADSLEEATRVLARKVAASIPGLAVTCDVRNSSGLDGGQLLHLSAAFQDELRKRGVKISPANSAASLVMTVSQDPTQYIGVVQIQRGGNSETLLQPLGPVQGSAPSEPRFTLTLHKEFLFAQDGPILDVLLENEAKTALALGPQEINRYQWRNDGWTLAGTEQIPRRTPADRGLRAFLYSGADSQAAYFPGELCRSSTAGAIGWNCERVREPWPVRSVTPELLAGKKTSPWFSAAQIGPKGNPEIVVTGQDGLARLYEDGPEPVASFQGWGSEIASAHSGCGSGWQLMVTGKGDWTAPDTVQAVEIQNRQAQPVSQHIEFAGPIIALHNPEMRAAPDNAGLVAIIRNLQTGRYEAYRLTIVCGS